MCSTGPAVYARGAETSSKPLRPPLIEERALSGNRPVDQDERLARIRDKVVTARRELDALIGDAYLRPRASIVPVHFLDLASAVEKLRWAEKEWRELDQEMGSASDGSDDSSPDEHPDLDDEEAELVGRLADTVAS